MSEQTTQIQRYMVSVHTPEEANGALVFTFAPSGVEGRGPAGLPKRVPQFIITVHQAAGGLAFDWSETSDDPGAAREEMEAEIAARMTEREIWMKRVASLVDQVESWAREMGWATRRVEKKLDDARIGTHRVPALLLQQETCRALLEPIGRSTPGAEGVVDLYLLPAYDDIASLYYYGHRWNLHYQKFPAANGAGPPPKTEAMPLSKEALEKVLAEIRQHAA